MASNLVFKLPMCFASWKTCSGKVAIPLTTHGPEMFPEAGAEFCRMACIE